MYYLKVYLFVTVNQIKAPECKVKRKVFGKRYCLKNYIMVCLKNSIVFSACFIVFGTDGVTLLCAVVGRRSHKISDQVNY